MARIISNKPDFLLKNASGKIGRFVIRQCNGQIILSARPTSYTLSQKPECVAARNRFKTASRWSTFLNRIPLLHEIWKASDDESLNVRTKILKENIKLVEEYFPTNSNTITPAGNHFKIKKVQLENDEIDIQMEDNFVKEADDKLVVITALVDPLKKRKEDFIIMDSSPESICNFVINFDTTELRSYKKIIVYFAIIRKKAEGICWSNTFAHEAIIR